ncbi:hypothetical protein AO843_07250 [Lysinibacillus sp. ZYM-1]|nr:hypothetical protein AO843_07250 [Lysinibacillus sp. ZYM-1]
MMYSTGYISEKEFRPYRKSISNFINNLDLDSCLKNSIKERLTHSYEYSLQKRLSDSIFSIDKCIWELFFSTEEEVEQFIQDIKKARNNLTHPNDQKTTNDSLNCFINYNRILKVIFMCILFKELGITEEIIRDCLLNDGEYSWFMPNKPERNFELPNI